MAQVTMDGKEYVESVTKMNKLEAENDLLIRTLITGSLQVDPTDSYRQVIYAVRAELPATADMDKYRQMRKEDIAARLVQMPLALQLLFDNGDKNFSANTGNFNSYSWDDYMPVYELSDEVAELWQKLENGERIAEMPEEEKEDEE